MNTIKLHKLKRLNLLCINISIIKIFEQYIIEIDSSEHIHSTYTICRHVPTTIALANCGYIYNLRITRQVLFDFNW